MIKKQTSYSDNPCVNYSNKQQDFSPFITFSSQGSSCPSPTYLLIFSGKLPIPRCCAVDQEALGTKFSSFRHYTLLSTLICHYSYYSLFAIRVFQTPHFFERNGISQHFRVVHESTFTGVNLQESLALRKFHAKARIYLMIFLKVEAKR